MAEKGILIKDQAGGESIATRDGFQSDNDSNARVIQIIDQAQRHVSFDLATPSRDVTASDGIDLSSLATGMTDTAFDVGDANSIVAQVHIQDTGALGAGSGVVITPLVVNSANEVLGILMPRFFSGYSAEVDPLNYTDGSSVKWTFCPIASWDTKGAERIIMHIQLVYCTRARVYAAPGSGLAELEMPSSNAMVPATSQWIAGAAAGG